MGTPREAEEGKELGVQRAVVAAAAAAMQPEAEEEPWAPPVGAEGARPQVEARASAAAEERVEAGA